MAKKRVTQQPILTTDVESTAPDISKTKTNIVKSRRRTSLDEFATLNNLRPEVKAGFRAWLQGNNFHFDNEWSELFEKYKNR